MPILHSLSVISDHSLKVTGEMLRHLHCTRNVTLFKSETSRLLGTERRRRVTGAGFRSLGLVVYLKGKRFLQLA